MRRQAELLGIAGNATTLPPAWLQDAEAAVGKCLNFELQLNSRLNYSIVGGITAHSVTETVESRVKLPFNIGVALFNEGYISSSPGLDPLIARAYDVDFAIGPLLPTISWPGSGEFCPPNSFEWMERHFAILRFLER